MTDVFRFMTLRGIQPNLSRRRFPPVNAKISDQFREHLSEARLSSAPLQSMSGAATELVASTSFVFDADRTGMPLSAFHETARGPEGATLERLELLVLNTFDSPAPDLVAADSFARSQAQISDSLVAAAILGSANVADVESLAAGLRALRLIEDVAARSALLHIDRASLWALAAPIQLPGELFPLPAPPDPNADKLIDIAKKERQREEEAAAERDAAAQRRAELGTAYRELRDLPPSAFELRQPKGAYDRIEREREQGVGAPAPPHPTWDLSAAGYALLSGRTQEILAEHGFATLTIETWPEAVHFLQNAWASMNASAASASPFKTFLGLGNMLIDAEELLADKQLLTKALVPPKPFRVVGAGDLEVVREKIQKYELGEIAHIENVLRGESKLRRHVRRRRIEETTVVETERIEESEQDLESTERFEQKNESDLTVQEDQNLAVGVTVNAAYGPFVDVTSEFEYSHSRSRTEANRSASKYARDVTSRSISRLHERIRKERTRKTIEEFEELNRHSLKNDDEPVDHVVGVYRWLDKIYKNQVFSYGQRLMFEFIVPEPGAFLLWARAQAREAFTIEMPKAPTKDPLDPNQKEPLTPDDIEPGNYLNWVRQYRLQGIDSPPDPIRLESFTLKTGDRRSGDGAMERVSMDKRIQLPQDYRAVAVTGTITDQPSYVDPDTTYDMWEDDHLRSLVDLFISKARAATLRSWATHRTAWFHHSFDSEKPTGNIGVSFQAYHGTMVLLQGDIICEPTDQAMARWRSNVYSAVISAYEDAMVEWERQKSEFEENARVAEIEEGVQISGQPPSLNRLVEMEELKKTAIRLLTGRARELEALLPDLRISSVAQPLAEWPPIVDLAHAGTPRPDLADRLPSEYVQFFEQSFEWSNMYFVLYPYYWARVHRWKALQQIDDVDPRHRDFLRAGAARVLVPVRPGFEKAILYYLQFQKIWHGGPVPDVTSPLYVSLVDEVRDGHGIVFHKADGTLTVQNGRAEVRGAGTSFDPDDDVHREILIEGVPYRIADVATPVDLTLSEPYNGADGDAAMYIIGAKYVDGPWPVKVPTTLVMLEKEQTPVELPSWTE